MIFLSRPQWHTRNLVVIYPSFSFFFLFFFCESGGSHVVILFLANKANLELEIPKKAIHAKCPNFQVNQMEL